MEENTAQPIQENPVTEKIEAPIVPPAHAEIKHGLMPKKTFLLIVLLVVITVCLLVLALIPTFNVPTKTKPVANLDYAQTSLSFSNPVVATPSGYSTNVLISTGKNKVTVAQLEITYDPKVLTNVDIAPGTFFPTPTVLLKKVDAVNGRISYVLGIGLGSTPVTGKGTVATLNFSTVGGTDSAKTPINFEPKTTVNAVNYAQSVLLKSTGVLFSITPTPAPTIKK
jgi:hypothetical protein